MNKWKAPVEICGYRNIFVPTYDPIEKCVVDKWWSRSTNDNHGDDEILPDRDCDDDENPPDSDR